MRIFVGLGNPGKEYEKTYHNAGRFALDEMRAALQARFSSAEEGNYKNFEYAKFPEAVLVYPLTYMNESGAAVTAALKHFGAGILDLTLIHDDSDLRFGEIRESAGGGAAGHHGVESVIESLGSKEFHRIRIGIRKDLPPEAPRVKAGDFVLKHMSREDEGLIRENLQPLIRKLTEKE
jgi:PTH1 family peptidyl-tRNA hydrolase